MQAPLPRAGGTICKPPCASRRDQMQAPLREAGGTRGKPPCASRRATGREAHAALDPMPLGRSVTCSRTVGLCDTLPIGKLGRPPQSSPAPARAPDRLLGIWIYGCRAGTAVASIGLATGRPVPVERRGNRA